MVGVGEEPATIDEVVSKQGIGSTSLDIIITTLAQKVIIQGQDHIISPVKFISYYYPWPVILVAQALFAGIGYAGGYLVGAVLKKNRRTTAILASAALTSLGNAYLLYVISAKDHCIGRSDTGYGVPACQGEYLLPLVAAAVVTTVALSWAVPRITDRIRSGIYKLTHQTPTSSGPAPS